MNPASSQLRNVCILMNHLIIGKQGTSPPNFFASKPCRLFSMSPISMSPNHTFAYTQCRHPAISSPNIIQCQLRCRALTTDRCLTCVGVCIWIPVIAVCRSCMHNRLELISLCVVGLLIATIMIVFSFIILVYNY